MLIDGCSGWRRRWQVGSFEVVRSKVGDATADIGAKLGDGLLDLGWVVVCLALICFRDPVNNCFRKKKTQKAVGSDTVYTLENSQVGCLEGFNLCLEVFVL